MTDDGLAEKLEGWAAGKYWFNGHPDWDAVAAEIRAHFASALAAQAAEIARLKEPKCECGRDLKWICSRCDAGKPTKFDEMTYRVEELEREQAEDRAAIRWLRACIKGRLVIAPNHKAALARAEGRG